MNTQFLSVEKGTIAYDDTGSGIPVLCVPGMGVTRAEFRYLTPQLAAAGFRVITMDLRGHGESSAEWDDFSIEAMGRDILALARHIDAGPVLLIGHSFSGATTVWASVEAPELVRGLALVGPSVRGAFGLVMRMLTQVLFTRPWGVGAWMWYYGTLFPARKPADWETYTAALRRNLTQPGRLEALRKLMFTTRKASEERMNRVSVPVLVVMGSKDPDFKDPEEEARWIAEQAGGSYRIIEGAGHYPQTEMPKITGPIITDFLTAVTAEDRYAQADR